MSNPFTRETENFMRLTLLINNKGVEAFREGLLHFSTQKSRVRTFDDVLHDVNVQRILQTLRGPGRGKPITAQQWLLLYPGTHLVRVAVHDLDITLCFVLLRNICGLAPPLTTWDRPPAPTDNSLEGGLAQLKNIRNFVSHCKEPTLSNADFAMYSQHACDAILNIAKGLPKWSTTQADLNEYQRRPIDRFLHEYLSRVVKEWAQQDTDIRTEIDYIKAGMDTMHKKVDNIGTELHEFKMSMDIQLDNKLNALAMDMVKKMSSFGEKAFQESKRPTLHQPGIEYTGSSPSICKQNICQQSVTSPPGQPEEERRKEMLRGYSDLLQNKHGGPSIYHLKLKRVRSPTLKMEFGKPTVSKQEKTIMLLGATGSGKTNLINGMVNFIFGVEWNDNFRVRLISEESTAANQAQSSTAIITSYTIHHRPGFQVPFTLTIVDIPEFGDAPGIGKDKEISDQIEMFLGATGIHGLEQITAIGFVTQSSLARLTFSQRYIFDSILSLFGKDIADNMVPHLTFADGQQPQVLDALKAANIPFKEFFKFNSSALFVANSKQKEEGDDFDEMFWKMGTKSFRDYFDAVETMPNRSLTFAKQLLIERECLQVQIEGINQDVIRRVTKLDQLDQEFNMLKNYKMDRDRNKDYTYTVDEEQVSMEKVPEGTFTTNCLICKRTCHDGCTISNSEDKIKCSVMRNGKCTVCKGNCLWSEHRHMPHTYKITMVKVTKTAEDLKRRYQTARGEYITMEKVVNALVGEIEQTHMEVILLSIKAKRCITRIREIALKPNPLSTSEYVDLMIEGEKNERKNGYLLRIKQLMEVRKTAEIVDQLDKEGYDPFDNHGDMIAKVKERSTLGKTWSKNKTMPNRSLTLTKQLLTERETLQKQIEGIHRDINTGVTKLHLLEQELDMLKKHEGDIERNKDFTYTVKEEQVTLIKVPEGTFTTNCLVCKRTCHVPCIFEKDEDKFRCDAMKDGNCIVCKGKCSWKEHRNLPHTYEIEMVQKTKTAEDLNKRYKSAKGEYMTMEKVVNGLMGDFKKTHREVIMLCIEAKRCITRIRDIALKPHPLSASEYVDLMIEGEKNERKDGFQLRIKQLQEVRNTAAIGEQPHPLSTCEYVDLMIEGEKNERKDGYQLRIKQLQEVRKTAEIVEQLTREGYDPFKNHVDMIAYLGERFGQTKKDIGCSVM